MLIGLIIFILIIIIGITTNILEDKKAKPYMSFKESMDLVELPIVTFINGNRKFNFLLDTGSNISHINASVLPALIYTEKDITNKTMGIEGNQIDTKFCEIKFHYKEMEFVDEFGITNLDNAFSIIKQESGVTIHGILGSKFFEKYKYILDFSKLTAYIKK